MTQQHSGPISTSLAYLIIALAILFAFAVLSEAAVKFLHNVFGRMQ